MMPESCGGSVIISTTWNTAHCIQGLLLVIERPLFIYTMTAGLGDLVVLGSLGRWITNLVPEARCLFVHRNNPHVSLWQSADAPQQFYNVHAPADMLRFISQARQARQEGYIAFGLQMAPGSLQGYFFLRGLQKLGAVEYVVDGNLINADIISPPQGEYILQRHARQMLTVCGLPEIDLPQRPILPFTVSKQCSLPDGHVRVGLHPWSRRGNQAAFVWQKEKWLALIQYLEQHPAVGEIVIVGKDDGFDRFRSTVMTDAAPAKIRFAQSRSVPELVATLTALDLLVSVNTGVVHIAHAVNLPQVILNGPSLDLWIPTGEDIIALHDQRAIWQAPDRAMADQRFSQVGNVGMNETIEAIAKFFKKTSRK